MCKKQVNWAKIAHRPLWKKFSFARHHVLHLLLSILSKPPLLRAPLLHNFGALRHVPIKTVSRMILLMTFALHYKFLQQSGCVFEVHARASCVDVAACIMSQKPWRARTCEHLAKESWAESRSGITYVYAVEKAWLIDNSAKASEWAHGARNFPFSSAEALDRRHHHHDSRIQFTRRFYQ